jgi:hypothetical protein
MWNEMTGSESIITIGGSHAKMPAGERYRDLATSKTTITVRLNQ